MPGVFFERKQQEHVCFKMIKVVFANMKANNIYLYTIVSPKKMKQT